MKTLEKINNFLKVSLATAAVIAMPHTTCFETYADADSYQNWRHINDSDGLIGQIRTNSRVSSVSNDYPDVVGAKAIIKANGSIEDIIINRGDNLSITFQLYPLLDYDVNVDWWGVAHADSSWYYLDNSMQWTQFDGNFSNCHPVFRTFVLVERYGSIEQK